MGDDEKPDMKFLKKCYTPFVKVPMDKTTKKPLDYDSRCKCNLYLKTGGKSEFNFLTFDNSKKKIDLTTDNCEQVISKGDDVMSVR